MARDQNYLHRMTCLFCINVSGIKFGEEGGEAVCGFWLSMYIELLRKLGVLFVKTISNSHVFTGKSSISVKTEYVATYSV